MKYFKNTSWLFMEKILRMTVGLFVGIWVARYLGPEQFGLFAYAGSFVGLFSAIATLGLDGIVVRELVKLPEKENELIGTAFVLKIVGAIFTLYVQFYDLVNSVFQTYSSFFRDRDYKDYYKEHCRFLENLIEFVEKHNKYYSLTPSFIPALKKGMK